MGAVQAGRRAEPIGSALGVRRRGIFLLTAVVVVLISLLVPAGVALADDPVVDASSTTGTTAEAGSTGSTVVAPTPESVPALEVVAAAAPAAGLTRYDAGSTLSYSGTWENFSRAAAYGGSYRRASTAGASVTIVFDGTQLDWIGMKGVTTGIADFYLDGKLIKTINLASPVAVYQQQLWSTGPLDSRIHTVKIVRNPSSASGKFITIDAVDIAGTLLPSQHLEQSDSRLAYKGPWLTRSGTAYSGGGDKYTDSSGAYMVINFKGKRLTWVGKTSSNYGIAKVTLDDSTVYAVDCYSGSPRYRQKLWETPADLSSGAHTVKIEVTANKNAASGDNFVSIDAFDVLGTVTQAYVLNRYEESEPRLLYSGAWSTVSAAGTSGGSHKRAGTSAAMVAVTFTGIRLDWIATMGPEMGVANVSVDNGAAQPVALFSDTTAYQQRVWSTGTLAAGTHRVEISWDEANAPGAAITLDAFDVLGSLPTSSTPTNAQVKWAEQRLADLSYRPGTIDGVFDAKTKGAVIAFQKWQGLTRDGKLTATVIAKLQTASRPRPSRSGASNPWIEVNKSKQVLLYCKNGAVVWTLPVSTGSASVGMVTPSGTFRVTRKTLETSPRYKPLYILPSPSLLAIHGYPSVPTSPASHGCVRTQLWDQDALHPLITVGTYVYVY